MLLAFTPSDFPIENSRHVDQVPCQWPFPLSRFQERAGERRDGQGSTRPACPQVSGDFCAVRLQRPSTPGMWWEVGATAQNPPIIPHSQMHLATPGLPCAPITSLNERLAEDGGQAEGANMAGNRLVPSKSLDDTRWTLAFPCRNTVAALPQEAAEEVVVEINPR